MDPADELDGDVGGAGDGDAQRGEVVPAAIGVVEDGLVQRRRPGQDGDTFRGDAGQHAVDVEDRLGQHGGAAGHAGQDARLEAEHVEVRVHLQVDVAGAETGHGHPVGGHRQRAPVRHDDALGDAGRPGGEEDVRGIVGPEGGAAAPHLGEGRAASRCRRSPTTPVTAPSAGPRATTIVSSAGRSTPGALEHRHVVGAEEVGHRHERPGPAPGEDDRRLGALEARVHRDQDRARGEQAQRGHDPLGAVAAPDRHPVAGLDARLDQGGGEASAPPGPARRRRASAAPSRTATRSAMLVGRAQEHGGDGGPGRCRSRAGL